MDMFMRKISITAIAFAALSLSSMANATSSLYIDSPTFVGYTSGFGLGVELPITYGVLSASGAGTVSYTYIGSNASFINGFGTSSNNYGSIYFGTLNTQDAFSTGGSNASSAYSTFTQIVSKAGALDFGFSTMNPVYSVNNSQNLQGNGVTPNEGVFGISPGTSFAGQTYQYFLTYNDPAPNGDHDFNDLVVGVNFVASPVPEAKTNAMMVVGLLLIGFMVIRRKVI